MTPGAGLAVLCLVSPINSSPRDASSLLLTMLVELQNKGVRVWKTCPMHQILRKPPASKVEQ